LNKSEDFGQGSELLYSAGASRVNSVLEKGRSFHRPLGLVGSSRIRF